MAAIVEFRNISKTFGGQRALVDLSLSFEEGRITALLGQNGSGKSTLIKILAGYYPPDGGDGEILVRGDAVQTPINPVDIYRRHVRFLHQDLAIVSGMSVSDNFQLVNGFGTKRRLGLIRQSSEDRHVAAVLKKFAVDVPADVHMSELAPSDQTMVAIARAFSTGDRPLIVLDEPTASLPQGEVEKVFTALRLVVSEGGSVIYVSHRLDEVRQIADDLVVLRDGHLVTAETMGDRSSRDIVELILGHALRASDRPTAPAGQQAVLEARGLSGARLQDVDLVVGRGEIVGVTGLLGCGRSELARVLAGAQRVKAGTMSFNGTDYAPTSPKQARRAGVGYVPQNRRREGVVGAMNVRENLSLSVLSTMTRLGALDFKRDRTAAERSIEQFGIVTRTPESKVDTLSGGNQQKTVFARNTMLDLKLFVLDEPTQGIDIGAKSEVAAICAHLSADGVGVVLASSDFEELASMCHRVLVLDRGVIADELVGDDVTVQQITASCFSAQVTAENRRTSNA